MGHWTTCYTGAIVVVRNNGCDAMSTVVRESTLTCPVCGHMKCETMPTDACVWFYACERCKSVLTPNPGDCCVFCSYGTNRFPPMQQSGSCCAD